MEGREPAGAVVERHERIRQTGERSAAVFGSSRQESENLAWFMGRHLRFALRI